MKNDILGIPIDINTEMDILEKIQKYLQDPQGFFHIVSLNPENLIESQVNPSFAEVLRLAQIRLIDGVGVAFAGSILGVPTGARITGVDLMKKLLKMAHENSFAVVLIGGKPKIAEKVVECQKGAFSRVNFTALEGIVDIKKPTPLEEEKLFSIVATAKPQFVFVAFGSPAQELWLYKNRHKLEGMVVMGVGGAFDFLSGSVPRAPRLARQIGLEWLFRLMVQPWRLRRQLYILKFIALVLKQKLLQ